MSDEETEAPYDALDATNDTPRQALLRAAALADNRVSEAEAKARKLKAELDEAEALAKRQRERATELRLQAGKMP